MKVNKKYIERTYVVFGQKARKDISSFVKEIIDCLEPMPKEERDEILANMNPEVRKAIIVD